MAFRLTRSETVGAAIQRVLGEELTAARASLREAADAPAASPGHDAGIHEARKSIKKLRAMMRLLEPRFEQLARDERAVLGEAGRSLSGARDAAAVVEILDVLAGQTTSRTALRSLTALRRRIVVRQAELIDVEPALKTLAEVSARLSEWPSLPDSFWGIGDGLQATYRRGRKALAAVAANPAAETFHALRKRVKEHWYQVRLLEGAWTEAEPREKELRELQECLGHEHDLTVLEQSATLVPTLQAVVARARREYRSQAVAIAAVLFAEKSRAHTERVQGHWQEWREHRPMSGRHVARKAPANAQTRHRRQVA